MENMIEAPEIGGGQPDGGRLAEYEKVYMKRIISLYDFSIAGNCDKSLYGG